MRIAISGCGITGTAAAFFLAQAGHEVTIFEQASECKPIGAGIMLQPSGQVVIKEMGLLDSLAECSQPLGGMIAQLTSGRKLVELRYEWLEKSMFGLGVHRGRLFDLLLNACRNLGVEIVNNARVIDCQEVSAASSKVRLQAEQPGVAESFGEFDFLIAADGSNSKLRDALRIKSKTIEYDYAALWMTGQSSFQPNHLFQMVEGTKYLIGLLPIGQGECSFFWGLRATDVDATRSIDLSTWKDQVIELCPESESILSTVSSFDQFTFAKYRHVTMQRQVADRVIFLGDSAHATSPHLGQGVNLGLEDASCFANCLSEVAGTSNNGDDVFSLVCRSFLKRRSSKVAYYQRLTKLISPFFQSDGKLKGFVRNVFLPWLPHTPFVRREMLRTLAGVKMGWLR